jgi:hypothetical protein
MTVQWCSVAVQIRRVRIKPKLRPRRCGEGEKAGTTRASHMLPIPEWCTQSPDSIVATLHAHRQEWNTSMPQVTQYAVVEHFET